MIVEREIKVLSHVKDIEKALDKLGISSRVEIQEVMSVRVGKESHKLKVKTCQGKKRAQYLYSKKISKKLKGKVTNENFSNKIEVETIYTKKEFDIIKKFFKEMYSNHKMMKYTIEKKRYESFMGYNVDICKVTGSKDGGFYYDKKFIEIEESNSVKSKDRIPVDKFIGFILPENIEIKTITCGLRNLNKYAKKLGIIKPSF